MLNEQEGPMIIISADGMCEAGRVVHHLANNIEDPTAQILIVGFMAAHTLGRKIKNREPEVKIMGEWHTVRAEVSEINALSAHADYSEMIAWLNECECPSLKRIFMVHGESDVQAEFKEKLEMSGYSDVQIVKHGERYAL